MEQFANCTMIKWTGLALRTTVEPNREHALLPATAKPEDNSQNIADTLVTDNDSNFITKAIHFPRNVKR